MLTDGARTLHSEVIEAPRGRWTMTSAGHQSVKVLFRLSCPSVVTVTLSLLPCMSRKDQAKDMQ